MARTKFVGFFLALILVFGLMLGTNAPRSYAKDTPAYVEGELLIQFRDNTSEADKEKVRGKANGVKIEKINEKANGKGDLELTAVKGDVLALASELSKDAAVEFAEPNWIWLMHTLDDMIHHGSDDRSSACGAVPALLAQTSDVLNISGG